MYINEFATRIASIVDLELFQNHCGMIYFDNLSSQTIAQKLGTKLKKQNVAFDYVHANTLTKSQRILDNLDLSTNLKIVYGFEALTCFFEQCLDAVLNPNIIQAPKDIELLSGYEFYIKYRVCKNAFLDFLNKFNRLIDFNFEKSLQIASFESMFNLSKHEYYESLYCFQSQNTKVKLTVKDLSCIYGLTASCFIQGLNFKPFSKTIVIIPQQLAKIIYEFMPYKGLFENCKDGYGVLGINSNWEKLTTFGSKACNEAPLANILSQYSKSLNLLNSIQEDLTLKILD
jgi:hypothetical protein